LRNRTKPTLTLNASLNGEDVEFSTWTIIKSVIREALETVILTLLIFFLLQSVIRNFRVEGHSMEPNLHHGQNLVVDKVSHKLFRQLERGDVIVFAPPTQRDKDFVKRIIGLPGETVEVRQGQIFIDNQPLEETFGAWIDQSDMPPQTVPEDSFFVLGDNRGNSNDSRNWGLLAKSDIVGRAWLSYWPPENWGLIPNNASTASARFSNLLAPVAPVSSNP